MARWVGGWVGGGDGGGDVRWGGSSHSMFG